MCALYNLRNALWYDLRGKEIAVLSGYSMADYAHNNAADFLTNIGYS